MNVYAIYFTDYPNDPMKCKADNYSDARKCGLRYIKAWHLDAEIYKIEKLEK